MYKTWAKVKYLLAQEDRQVAGTMNADCALIIQHITMRMGFQTEVNGQSGELTDVINDYVS